jgi:hypothetical protein
VGNGQRKPVAAHEIYRFVRKSQDRIREVDITRDRQSAHHDTGCIGTHTRTRNGDILHRHRKGRDFRSTPREPPTNTYHWWIQSRSKEIRDRYLEFIECHRFLFLYDPFATVKPVFAVSHLYRN